MRGGGVPMGSHARRAAEVADIFISLGRNENSAMTVGGGVVGFRTLFTDGERGEAALRGTHSQAALGNDREHNFFWMWDDWGAGFRWGVMPAVRRRSRIFSFRWGEMKIPR